MLKITFLGAGSTIFARNVKLFTSRKKDENRADNKMKTCPKHLMSLM